MLRVVSAITVHILLITLVLITYPKPAGGQGQSRKLLRKIKIPKGSSLSLTIQISRPKILTQFVSNDDAVILDGVIEVPMWMDLDRFADAMYGIKEPDGPAGPKSNVDQNLQYRGKERCLLYGHLEALLSTLFFLPARKAHSCLLRAICEIHEISTFYFPDYSPSFAFELIHLFLSPSLGGKDECHKEYRVAEERGRRGICYKFNTNCPINISALIFTKLIPHQQL